MKYYIDYQYLPTGDRRPRDDGDAVGIEASDQGGLVVLPNTGDYVEVINGSDPQSRVSFAGKVRSRLFQYLHMGQEQVCRVNIVVEETTDDWKMFSKE